MNIKQSNQTADKATTTTNAIATNEVNAEGKWNFGVTEIKPKPMELDTVGFKYKPMRTGDEPKPKLKHSTSQKRVELIEKQKWELIAATATIDNQSETIYKLNLSVSALENSLGIKRDEIKVLTDQSERLNLELAELDITLKSKDLQIEDLTLIVKEKNVDLKRAFAEAEQLVKECQAMEEKCKVVEAEKIAYRDEALSQSKRIGDLNKEVDKLTTTSDRAVLLAAIFGIIAIGEALAIYCIY